MSVRTRIFLVFVTAVVAGFALLAYWVSSDVADRYSESFEEIMVDSANLLAEIITTDLQRGDQQLLALEDAFARLRLRRFTAQIYEIEKTSVDIRVYVTNKQGIVIYDSDHGLAVGEDYSTWRDVHLTLSGQYGARATQIPGEFSTGDPGQQLTIAYVAAPIYQHGEISGVVTIAKPKNNIDRFVANAKFNLMLAIMISVVIVVLLGLLLYIWVSRPLRALVQYANGVSVGARVELPDLGNNEIGKVGAAIDNMRQALEDKQYVERYVQSLTHELKSPLTAIHAAAELLGRDLPPDKRTQFMQTILIEAERLNTFADQLLQLAALEKRKKIEAQAVCELHDLLQAIIAVHTVACEQRKLQLVYQADAQPQVIGDCFLIRQAIDNLLRNAIAFAPAHSEIRVRVQRVEAQAVVEIMDVGPGIPAYVGERVFERFFSLPRPDTGQKSTGLGLNFAREVAQLHGGSLALENRSPGTCARMFLPLANR